MGCHYHHRIIESPNQLPRYLLPSLIKYKIKLPCCIRHELNLGFDDLEEELR